MNKIITILIASLVFSCTPNKKKENIYKPAEKITKAGLVALTEVIKVPVDTERSVVQWKGTKMMRTGKHLGTVSFKEGELWFSEGQLAGGQFVVDMQSIYNTDIPLDDPVPRKNLTNHLNSDFETDIYPIATFKIIQVEKSGPEHYIISGDMTIKGITKPIKITAREIKREKEYVSSFTFDRFDWKIGEDGTWLEKKLVDAAVSVKIKVVVL